MDRCGGLLPGQLALVVGVDLAAHDLGVVAGADRAEWGHRWGGSGQGLEALLEPAGVALLGPGQGLQPLGDLDEALVAGGLGEAQAGGSGMAATSATASAMGVGPPTTSKVWPIVDPSARTAATTAATSSRGISPRSTSAPTTT